MTPEGIVARFNVTIQGDPRSPAGVVFVNGFGTNQSFWRFAVPGLPEGMKFVFYDMPGSGAVSMPANEQHRYLQLDTHAEDLVAICSAVGLRRVALVGHSVGAMISVRAAVRAPALVECLALIGASPRYLDDASYRGGFTPETVDAIYSAVMGDHHGWAAEFAAAMMGHWHPPARLQEFVESLRSVPTATVLTVLCAIFQSDCRAHLVDVSQPVLLLNARDDAAVPPEVADYLQEHLRNSRLVQLEASGHLPHLTAPGEVSGVLAPFLAEWRDQFPSAPDGGLAPAASLVDHAPRAMPRA